MEEYITWYQLQLKAWVMRKNSWLMLAGVILIIVLISQIHLPSSENTKAGIYIPEDKYTEKMLDVLDNMESIFEFRIYNNPEKMKEDVIVGKLECGFIVEDNFETRIFESEIKDIVTYVCTPMTTKGEILKETFYAAFLQIYGEVILIDSEEKIYGLEKEEITQKLLEKYEYYLENSRLLEMNTELIETTDKIQKEKEADTYPIQGLAAVFIFLMLWYEGGRRFEKGGTNVYAVLDRKRRNIFEFTGYLASATTSSTLLLIIILIFTNSRSKLEEIVAMLMFVIFCSLWMLVVGRLFKNSTTFVSWAMALSFVQVLICPVFVDLAEYFPALEYIRLLFPTGWYLN